MLAPGSANISTYTLHSMEDERSPLLPGSSGPGSVPELPQLDTPVTTASAATPSVSQKGAVWQAIAKLLAALGLATTFVALILWLVLPHLSREDKGKLQFPTEFAELQALNLLLKKYRGIYPYRIFICYAIVYLYLQAFCIPGSTSLSILAGAVWGVPLGMLIICSCVAIGGSACYVLSGQLGGPLLSKPSWRARLDEWSAKVNSQRENLLPFFIVLRISPLPPHWFVSLAAPHLGIGFQPFVIGTFLGTIGISIIHTSIGSGLEQMTSPDDFHLLSWRNFFLLTCIALAVLFPVALRRMFSKQVVTVIQEAPPTPLHQDADLESGLGGVPPKAPVLVRLDDDETGEVDSGRVR